MRVEDRAARHAGRAESFHDLELGVSLGPRSNDGVHLVEAGVPLGRGVVALVADQVFALDGPKQTLPHARGSGHDVCVVVGTAGGAGIGVGGRGVGEPITGARHHGAGLEVVAQRHAHVVDDRVLHGHLDVLTAGRLGALDQRGQDADRAVQAGARIADGRAGLEGRPAGQTGHAQRAARGQRDGVEALVAAPRPGSAEALDRGIDQPRAAFAQVRVAETEAVHRTGREVFQHDVDVVRQRAEQVAALIRLEVERDAALVGVEQNEEMGIQPRPVGQETAARFANAWRFDFDDVRAEKGQQLGARRAGLEMRQVQDADVIQGEHGGVPYRIGGSRKPSIHAALPPSALSIGNDVRDDPGTRRVGGDGRGDLGVRFDVSTGSTHRKLNELRNGKVS